MNDDFVIITNKNTKKAIENLIFEENDISKMKGDFDIAGYSIQIQEGDYENIDDRKGTRETTFGINVYHQERIVLNFKIMLKITGRNMDMTIFENQQYIKNRNILSILKLAS